MKKPLVLYTVKQVAELLHIDEMTVREWAKDGLLNGTKIGRKWLFSEKEILDQLNFGDEENGRSS